MSYRLCIDIGGTFTDLVAVDEKGQVNIFKSPTTPDDFSRAFIETLKLASEHYGVKLNDLMAHSSSGRGGYLAHGSTVSTNAIIENKVAKTGLVCTRGFRDLLLAREGGKAEPYNWQMEWPRPYIPRYLTMPVTERINAEGGIEKPLDEGDVIAAINKFKEYKVEAVAVALLWSIANPDHELKIGEIIAREWPGVPFSLSHQVNPCIREYRRTSSTAIDASLKPLVSQYVVSLQKKLAGIGYNGELSLLTSSGGIISADELIAKPVYSVDCGPALAPSAGRLIAARELKTKNVITTDMGGTSFDVACITGGEISVSRESLVGGHMLGVNKVDSKSIGAGGGSIAWVDKGGLLNVGPQSAGAVPGPVCYGKGGTEPTVTDANVALGYLDPDYFLGGRMKLDSGLARKAITEKIARPLKVGLDEAAYAIWGAVNAGMANVIRDITIWQGIDPRGYLVVSGGGAAGLHIGAIARELGVKKVLIPKVAGALSAYGGVFADITSDFSASKFAESAMFDFKAVNDVLKDLRDKAESFLDRMAVPKKMRKLTFYSEARYPNQVWELSVPLRRNRIESQKQLKELMDDFHNLHKKVFTVNAPEQPVEFVYWRVKAVGEMPVQKAPKGKASAKRAAAALKGKRKAYFRALKGSLDTPVYDGARLSPGMKISSPAIIEEPTTTILVAPGSTVKVTDYGSYLLELM